jgi:hypothetical protein
MASLSQLPQVLKTPVKVQQRTALQAQVERSVAVRQELYSDPLLNLPQVQSALGGISYKALDSLMRSGKLKCWRINPNGHRKVRLSVLREFIAVRENGGAQ